MLLSIVIPAYNEARTIAQVIDRARTIPLPDGLEREIIVVDDGSNDDSRAILTGLYRNGEIRLIVQLENRGKGAALRAAFDAMGGDLVIVQDADLEYDPADYQSLLAPILSGHADVVFGTRFSGGGAHRVHLFWHMLGNKALTLLSNATTGLNLSDMEVGYKAFRAEVLRAIRVQSERFGVEPELTAKVAQGGWRVYEVPISYFGRSYAEGKKIGWKDGVEALVQIVRFGVIGRLRARVSASQRRPHVAREAVCQLHERADGLGRPGSSRPPQELSPNVSVAPAISRSA